MNLNLSADDLTALRRACAERLATRLREEYAADTRTWTDKEILLLSDVVLVEAFAELAQRGIGIDFVTAAEPPGREVDPGMRTQFEKGRAEWSDYRMRRR